MKFSVLALFFAVSSSGHAATLRGEANGLETKGNRLLKKSKKGKQGGKVKRQKKTLRYVHGA
jgi:hypothetical protein